MTLSDLERLNEILNDTKQRAVSLRQLSFLSLNGCLVKTKERREGRYPRADVTYFEPPCRNGACQSYCFLAANDAQPKMLVWCPTVLCNCSVVTLT